MGDEIYSLGYPGAIFGTGKASPVSRIGVIFGDPILGGYSKRRLGLKWGCQRGSMIS
jgi:hypothetical protein